MSDKTIKPGDSVYFDRSLVEGLTPSRTGLRNGSYRVAEVKYVAENQCLRLVNNLVDNRFYSPLWFRI